MHFCRSEETTVPFYGTRSLYIIIIGRDAGKVTQIRAKNLHSDKQSEILRICNDLSKMHISTEVE